MTPRLYVDTSLIVSLIDRSDSGHDSAQAWFTSLDAITVTSVITEVELRRVLSRRGVTDPYRRLAERLLGAAERVEVGAEVRGVAGGLVPASMRSLDAIHVATALVAEVAGFATLDHRQAQAAEEAGLTLVH